MTETVKVCGYDPFHHQEPVDVSLHIVGTPPEMDSFDRAVEWYESQARIVTDVIIKNLPQGVTHRVLARLLELYASSYRGKTGT